MHMHKVFCSYKRIDRLQNMSVVFVTHVFFAIIIYSCAMIGCHKTHDAKLFDVMRMEHKTIILYNFALCGMQNSNMIYFG